MSDLLSRIRALRAAVPMSLKAAKAVVEENDDRLLIARMGAAPKFERAERRERIATAVAAGMAAAEGQNQNVHLESRDPIWFSPAVLAEVAVERADALLAELDRRRDAEMQEAR